MNECSKVQKDYSFDHNEYKTFSVDNKSSLNDFCLSYDSAICLVFSLSIDRDNVNLDLIDHMSNFEVQHYCLNI